MQEAIRDYIEINKREKSFDDIEKDIIRVGKSEIKRARKKQYIEWRKLNKIKGANKS